MTLTHHRREMKLFLDTMIWLHYQSADDLDWSKVMSTNSVPTIVVPRITTRELDKHKNSHRSARVRDRARRWLKKLTALPADDQLKNGARLELYLAAPKIDWAAQGLDASVNDDVLLATILNYRQAHPQDEVRFYTADATPQLMAANLGIPVFEFPEELKLDEEPDPTAKELRELKAEVERSKRARPKLHCGFLAAGKLTTNVVFGLSRPPAFPEKEMQEHLTTFSEKFSVKPFPRYSNPREALIGQMLRADEAEYDRYNREVATYPARFTAYFRECYARLVFEVLATLVHCQVQNDGETPADDVDLELHFPAWCRVMETIPEEPHAPSEPEPPKSLLDVRMPDYSAVARPFFATRPETEPFSIRANSSGQVVKKHFERIKHGHAGEVNAFLVTFSDLAKAKSFKVKGRITAANLREPTDVLLNVQIRTPDAR